MLKSISKTTVLIVITPALLFFSCATNYKASYFMDVPPSVDTVFTTVTPNSMPKIKYGDVLSLSVEPLDQLTNLYQTPVTGGAVPFQAQSSQLSPSTSGSSFLVDKNGTIEAPLIGLVKLSNLTIDEAKEVLRLKYAIFYKTFTLNLSFLNHKITVLGEVARPGSFNIQTDEISIFDAISMAGDITVYGKKDNILLLRDSSGNKKHMVRLNLNSKNILHSPYYYLKNNDMVYVEPSRSKLASTDAYRTRNLAIFTTVLSFILIITTRTKIL
jgi:polysaccharide export outer membrane protein